MASHRGTAVIVCRCRREMRGRKKEKKENFCIRVQTGYYANMMYLTQPAWAFSGVFYFRVCAVGIRLSRLREFCRQ